MTRLLLFSLLIFVSQFLSAQKHPLYVSLEGGGNGLIASANIAKTIIRGDYYKVILQTGLGWPSGEAKSKTAFDVPVQLTCNFGQQLSFFEAGAGATIIPFSERDVSNGQTELYMSPVIGFRHESNNWFGRVYLCPLFRVTGQHINDEVTKNFINFGIGIGAIL